MEAPDRSQAARLWGWEDLSEIGRWSLQLCLRGKIQKIPVFLQ